MRLRTSITAGYVADVVGGTLIGPPALPLGGVAPLDRAGPDELSLVATRRYLDALRESQAAAVLIGPALAAEPGGPEVRIVVPDPALALQRLLRLLFPDPPTHWGIDPLARIGRGTRWVGRVAIAAGARLGNNVRLGRDCTIGLQAVIGNDVTVGDACTVGNHATICPGVTLGDRVTVRSGARVGGPGFGFVRGKAGQERLVQLGGCRIGDDVEVGANTTIDRGSLGDTEIGSGTKIDNLVQIAHNVRVGDRCIVMAQVGIAGSTVVEEDAVLAGQAGLADHLTVGRGARIAAQSGVIGDIPAGATVSGYPARDHRSVLRQTAAIARLTPLVSSLERTLHRDE